MASTPPRLPPPPILERMDSAAWRDWFHRLYPVLLQAVAASSGKVAWTSQIDFTGSNLTDLVTRAHNSLQTVQGYGTEAWHFDAVAGKANYVGGVNAAANGTEWKQLVAGSNVTITHAAGSITINSSNPGGTVTSVGLSAPAIFTVAGSPVTGSGNLSFSANTQSANTFWAGPTTGAAAAPTFRTIVAADVPAVGSMSLQSKSSDPSTSDVPAGTCSIWKNTTSGTTKLWCNNGGTLVSVALT